MKAPVSRPTVVALCAVATLAGNACTWRCGSSVYPDVPEFDARLAVAMTHAETGPPLPSHDVAPGRGRAAQWGRKVGLRVTFRDTRGTPLGRVEGLFLFPPIERSDFETASIDVDSGQMPAYFGPLLAGLRVGGVRRFTLLAAPTGEPWRVRPIGATNTTEIPATQPVTTDIELLSVCKPKICLVTTWSVPAASQRRVAEFGCD